MDEELVLKRFNDNFRITAEEIKEIEQDFTQYILFRRDKNGILGYCTGCKQRLALTPYYEKVKHRREGICPNCRARIKFYLGGKVPASKHREKCNFVLLRAIKGELYMRAIEVRQWFVKKSSKANEGISEYDTHYVTCEHRLYWCGKGEAVEWEHRNYAKHRILKGLHEPRFDYSFYPDNSYTVIGLKQIGKTCLKYCGYKEYIKAGGLYLVKFLCLSAKYPAYEKLIKAGFVMLVKEKLARGSVRLNLRGDTPQKILGLNSAEIKEFMDCSSYTYGKYRYFKKYINVPGSFERKLEVFRKWDNSLEDIVSIAEKTGLSHTKVMNYIERNTENKDISEYYFIHDWEDYLHQCEELDYDLSDESISKPKDLQKMHERLSEILETKKVEIEQRKFRESMEHRAAFEYRGEEYSVIQPKSVDEIVDEGKALKHCVAGYAPRHAAGALSIMFLRKNSELDQPYYTIEVSNAGKIVQCRGYMNDRETPKPDSIKQFEKEYQKHLDSVMAERAKRKKPVKKTELKIGA